MSFDGTNITIETGCPSERILIISPTRARFQRWCHENGINPTSENVIHISSPKELLKYTDVWYVDLGGVDPEYYRMMELYEFLTKCVSAQEFKEIPR